MVGVIGTLGGEKKLMDKGVKWLVIGRIDCD
jgi:hypothetical protein